jgi:hypothetical protein
MGNSKVCLLGLELLLFVQEEESREPIQFPKPITEEMIRSASV